MSLSDIALSVVLPAYEEAANLEVLLPRLKESLSALKVPYEILIVDTMTPRDNTAEVCQKHGIRCIPRTGGNTFGDAYRTGIAETKGYHVLFMDADGSHPPEFIKELYQHAFHYDVVIASRYVEGGGTEVASSLQLMSRILNWTYSLVFGIRCRDMSNSYKIYTGKRLRNLDIRCNNFDVLEEILVGMKWDGNSLRIKEVPFQFQHRKEGESKRNLFSFILSYAYTLIWLRFRSWSKPKAQPAAKPASSPNQKVA